MNSNSVWRYLVLYLAAFVLIGGASALLSVPGYMDSEYYYAGAINLMEGRGFWENYIWNYLSQPDGIPNPSHLYWMPMPSIIAYLGMRIFGASDFFYAKSLYLFLAALIPVATVLAARKIGASNRDAWLAGGASLFPGIFVVYWSIPESFTLCALLGAGIILLLPLDSELTGKGWKSYLKWLVLGILTGCMHLSRADGILWVVAVVGFTGLLGLRHRKEAQKLRVAIIGVGLVLVGYLLVMVPWYARNVHLFGSPMSPGGNKTLWLTDYNQTFSFFQDDLNFGQWFESGLDNILEVRGQAFVMNLKNFVGAQSLVVLFPLMLLGLWEKRKDPKVKFVMAIWGIIFLVMTLIFPFAGSRGGYLHSASSIQVFVWILAAIGFSKTITWGVRVRGWTFDRAYRMFAVLLFALLILLTAWFYHNRVVGSGDGLVWLSSFERYQKADIGLSHLGFADQEVGMVNNPPGFFLATGRPAIVIPGGDISETLAAADKFNATFLLLDESQANLWDLYLNPVDLQGLNYLGTFNSIHYFAILPK